MRVAIFGSSADFTGMDCSALFSSFIAASAALIGSIGTLFMQHRIAMMNARNERRKDHRQKVLVAVQNFAALVEYLHAYLISDLDSWDVAYGAKRNPKKWDHLVHENLSNTIFIPEEVAADYGKIMFAVNTFDLDTAMKCLTEDLNADGKQSLASNWVELIRICKQFIAREFTE